MSAHTGKVNAGKFVEMSAVVFPPCAKCGEPYTPTKPVEDYGTVFFNSPDLIANLLYRIERFMQRLRRARMRSL